MNPQRNSALIFLFLLLAGQQLSAGVSRASPLCAPRSKTGDRLASLPWPLAGHRLWIVSYFTDDSPRSTSRAVYIDYLTRRYPELGARTVVAGKARDLALQLERRKPLLPPVVDADGSLARALTVSEPRNHLWLVCADGAVEFHAKGLFPTEDELRQLVERGLPGDARQAARPQVSLRPGEALKPFAAERVPNGTPVVFDPHARERFDRVLFFAADCAPCSLESSLDDLARAGAILGGRGKRLAAVFSSRFDSSEIAAGLSLRHITMPVFLSHQELGGLEDLYNLKHLVAEEVLVDLDAAGRVTVLLPLPQALERR